MRVFFSFPKDNYLPYKSYLENEGRSDGYFFDQPVFLNWQFNNLKRTTLLINIPSLQTHSVIDFY